LQNKNTEEFIFSLANNKLLEVIEHLNKQKYLLNICCTCPPCLGATTGRLIVRILLFPVGGLNAISLYFLKI